MRWGIPWVASKDQRAKNSLLKGDKGVMTSDLRRNMFCVMINKNNIVVKTIKR